MARKSYQEGTVFLSANGKWRKGRYRVWEIGCDGNQRRVQKNVTLAPCAVRTGSPRQRPSPGWLRGSGPLMKVGTNQRAQ